MARPVLSQRYGTGHRKAGCSLARDLAKSSNLQVSLIPSFGDHVSQADRRAEKHRLMELSRRARRRFHGAIIRRD